MTAKALVVQAKRSALNPGWLDLTDGGRSVGCLYGSGWQALEIEDGAEFTVIFLRGAWEIAEQQSFEPTGPTQQRCAIYLRKPAPKATAILWRLPALARKATTYTYQCGACGCRTSTEGRTECAQCGATFSPEQTRDLPTLGEA